MLSIRSHELSNFACAFLCFILHVHSISDWTWDLHRCARSEFISTLGCFRYRQNLKRWAGLCLSFTKDSMPTKLAMSVGSPGCPEPLRLRIKYEAKSRDASMSRRVGSGEEIWMSTLPMISSALEMRRVKPRTSKENSCMTNCVNRFMDSNLAVLKHLERMRASQ